MLSYIRVSGIARELRKVFNIMEETTMHIRMEAFPKTISNLNTVKVVILLGELGFVEHYFLPEDMRGLLEKGYKEVAVSILQYELEHYDVELLYEDMKTGGEKDAYILNRLNENRRNFEADVKRILSSSYCKGEPVV